MTGIQLPSITFSEQSIRRLLEEQSPVNCIADLRHHKDSPMTHMDCESRRDYVLQSMTSRIKTILEVVWNALKHDQSACTVQLPLLFIGKYEVNGREVKLYDSAWLRYEEYFISLLRSKAKIQADLSKASQGMIKVNHSGAPAVSEHSLSGASTAIIRLHWERADSEHIKEWLAPHIAPAKDDSSGFAISTITEVLPKTTRESLPQLREECTQRHLGRYLKTCEKPSGEQLVTEHQASKPTVDQLFDSVASTRLRIDNLLASRNLLSAEGYDVSHIQADIDALERKNASSVTDLGVLVHPTKSAERLDGNLKRASQPLDTSMESPAKKARLSSGSLAATLLEGGAVLKVSSHEGIMHQPRIPSTPPTGSPCVAGPTSQILQSLAQRVLPGIKEGFTAMGGQKSSAFRSAISQAIRQHPRSVDTQEAQQLLSELDLMGIDKFILTYGLC